MASEYFRKRMAEINAENRVKALSPEEELARNRGLAKESRQRLKKEYQKRNGYVYFLRAGNAVKIGFSTNLKNRQHHLKTNCPDPAFICKYLMGTLATEASFHRRFAEYRIRGEWFDLRGTLAKYLERHIHPVELPAPVPPPTPGVIWL